MGIGIRILYTIISGFLIGVFLNSFIALDSQVVFLVVLISFGIFLYVRFLSSQRGLVVLLLPVFFLSASLGVWRYSSVVNQGSLNKFVGERVSLIGLVYDEPDKRENSTMLSFHADRINDQEVSENVLITVPIFPEYDYGDYLKVEAILKMPENFANENGREFDYVSYLAKDDIHYKMVFPKIEVLEKDKGNFIKRNLFSLKNSFVENVGRIIPEPASSLAGGLIVGAKQSLGKDLLNDFRIVGLIHIVVLSGYNITIVAQNVMRFLRIFISNKLSIIFGIVTIVLFAIMVGAGATVVRASVMALLALLARATGRIYTLTHALVLAGFLMVFWNPKVLVFDPSFQLSFMATIGLILVSPIVFEKIGFITEKWGIREVVASTISVQIFVLPMILWMMGDLSLIAPFVNVIVLPFIPITMLFGFLTGAMGFVSYTLSVPFGYIAYALLSFELFVTETFAKLPFSSVSIRYFPFWVMCSVYVIYGIYLYKYRLDKAVDDMKI